LEFRSGEPLNDFHRSTSFPRAFFSRTTSIVFPNGILAEGGLRRKRCVFGFVCVNRSRVAAASTSHYRPHPIDRNAIPSQIAWESVDCGIREVRDSERQTGHDLSLIGPKTDVRMPHEQVGSCRPLGQGECVLFKCCPSPKYSPARMPLKSATLCSDAS
jgi:hypothetical protein